MALGSIVVVVASLLQQQLKKVSFILASPAVPLFFQASRSPLHYFRNVRICLLSVLPDYRYTHMLARAPLRILACAEVLFSVFLHFSNRVKYMVLLGFSTCFPWSGIRKSYIWQ
jgi:hypothetical protein